MSEIKIGKLYQYKDNGKTLLTGDQLVEVISDTRGGIGGGIIVRSKATNVESKVDRSQLHEYIPPPSIWKKVSEQTLMGFANKVGLLISAALGMLLRPFFVKALHYILNLLTNKK